jgi:hypothetical protein
MSYSVQSSPVNSGWASSSVFALVFHYNWPWYCLKITYSVDEVFTIRTRSRLRMSMFGWSTVQAFEVKTMLIHTQYPVLFSIPKFGQAHDVKLVRRSVWSLGHRQRFIAWSGRLDWHMDYEKRYCASCVGLQLLCSEIIRVQDGKSGTFSAGGDLRHYDIS